MPPVVIGAALATGAGVAFKTVAAGAIFSTFATNLALGLISQALAPKPPSIEAQTRDNTITAREPISSRKIVYGRSRVGGTIVYLESTGSDNKFLHLVIAVAGHEVDAFEEVYFDDELVWDGGSYQSDWGSFTRLNFATGTDSQVADSDLVSESAHWTSDHRLRGVAYLYVRLTFDQNKFSSGIPNISAVVRGKKVFDPRSSTAVWSSNPALCIRDYLLDTKYGMGVDESELASAAFISAANLCDEDVTTTTGTQDRYTLDGVIDSGQPPKNVLESMLTSCAGSLVYSGGEFYLYPSEYRTPTITLNESVVIDSIQVQTRKSRRDLFNAVKGVFSSTEDNYILTDYPAIISSTFAAEDGDAIYLDVNLPYTTDPIRAERIAKLSLLRTRQQISATIVCNLSALRLKAGDTVMITNARMGWTSKVFEILNLTLTSDSVGALAVSMQILETSSAVYDWTTGDEIAYVAGQPTTLASPFFVNVPTNLVVTASTLIQEDGTSRPGLNLSWVNADAFTREFDLQYQKDSGSFTSILTRENSYRIEDITVGSSYTVKVRSINSLGAKSGFIDTTISGTGDAVAPGAPSGLSATGGANSIYLAWTNPSDADLDVIQIYEGTSSVQANATFIATTKASSFTRSGLSDGVTRYYWLKAVDYSGNVSGFNSPTGVSATTVTPFSQADVIGDIEIVNSLTAGLGAGDEGKVEFLTTDNKIYLWTGSAWITGVAASDLTGQITGVQITDNAITAAKIAANTITASQIAAGTITAAQIAASTITSDKLSVANLSAISADLGTITAGSMSADRITTGVLSAQRISVDGITLDRSGSNLIIRNGGVSTVKLVANAATDLVAFASGTLSGVQTMNIDFTMAVAGDICCVVDYTIGGSASNSSSIQLFANIQYLSGTGNNTRTISLSGIITLGPKTLTINRINSVSGVPAGSWRLTVQTLNASNIGSLTSTFNGAIIQRYR